MHFNFDFTAVQVLWTLTFAAHLVLLVVLMGRERIRRFPWFTTGIVLVTLRLLSSRLLYGRLPQLTMGGIFIVLADVTASLPCWWCWRWPAALSARASRRAWIVWTLVLLALGGCCIGHLGNLAGVEDDRVRHPAGAPGTDAAVRAETRPAGGRAHRCAGTARGSVRPPLRSRMAQPRAADHDRPLDRVAGAAGGAGNLADHRQDCRASLHGGIPAHHGLARKAVQCQQRSLSAGADLVDRLPVDRRAREQRRLRVAVAEEETASRRRESSHGCRESNGRESCQRRRLKPQSR